MFEKRITILLIIFIGVYVKCQEPQIIGFYRQSWTKPTAPPLGINLGVCFSGWIKIKDVLTNCARVKAELPPGNKFLSFGGGQTNGRWSTIALSNLDSGVKNKQLAGWDGIVYDIEEGDSGLALDFSSSFANAKANGLSVLVTISHSQPYGIPDAASLMDSFFSDSNIDYISPQLYTSGKESSNDYTALGTMWKAYAKAKAKIVPSVVLGSRDFPTAKTQFSQFGVQISGFIQWSQGAPVTSDTSNLSGCHPNYYNQCTSNSQCCSNNCDDNNGAWALGVCKPNSGASPSHASDVSGCHSNYYNQCTCNSECCSNNCDDNNGAWALGVCKPNSGVQVSSDAPSLPGCQPNFYNKCTSNSQCCSNNCDDENGAWALGVCRPN